MATVRLTERITDPFRGCTVDREKGVVRGILLCGTDSANGRRYPWGSALKGDIAKYEGRPVNCDHADAATVDRRVGWVTNPRAGDDGRPRGDLHLLLTHPLTPRVLEAAERNPALFGLSHVAMCRTRREGGTEVVESIEAVESVDLVADPATVKGMFESRRARETVGDKSANQAGQKGAMEFYDAWDRPSRHKKKGKKGRRKGRKESLEGPTVAGSIREYLDKLAPRMSFEGVSRVKLSCIREDFGDVPMAADAPPADDAGTSEDDGITAAFESAIMAIVRKALGEGQDKKAVLKKIGKLLDGHGDAMDDDVPDDEGGGEEETASESGKGKGKKPVTETPAPVDPWDVVEECAAEKYTPTQLQLLALKSFPDKARRVEYIRECKGMAKATEPKSVGREGKPGGQKVEESGGGGDTPKTGVEAALAEMAAIGSRLRGVPPASKN